MQAIKTVALREAENTSRRIREQVAWFYLRHMNIDEDAKPYTVFNGLLTRKECETLPAPQGEKEKAVRQELCTRSALLEAQLYDTINAYTKLFIMNDSGIPADLRKKLNAELEQFNSQTTQTMVDKSASCVRRNASADEMAEELLAVFNKAAKKLSGDIDGAYMQASWYYLLHCFVEAGYREFQYVVEHKDGLCETCLSLSEKTFTLEELVEQELLSPLHPNCRCAVVPVYATGRVESRTSGGFGAETTNWYDGLLQIPTEAKALLNGIASAQQERIGRRTLGGFLDWLTMDTISGFYNGLKTRASAVAESPSLYNIANWLTLGMADTVKGAVAPEKPLSFEHWLNALGTVSIAAGAYELAQKYAPTMIDDVAAFENTARHPFHDSAISSEYISDSEQLIQQLEQRHEKITRENIMRIEQLPSGKIVWLETGNERAGFEHILKHLKEFEKQGLPEHELADYIMDALKNGELVGMQGTREIYEVTYNGITRRVAITVSDNGFIIGANPKSIPKP